MLRESLAPFLSIILYEFIALAFQNFTRNFRLFSRNDATLLPIVRVTVQRLDKQLLFVYSIFVGRWRQMFSQQFVNIFFFFFFFSCVWPSQFIRISLTVNSINSIEHRIHCIDDKRTENHFLPIICVLISHPLDFIRLICNSCATSKLQYTHFSRTKQHTTQYKNEAARKKRREKV